MKDSGFTPREVLFTHYLMGKPSDYHLKVRLTTIEPYAARGEVLETREAGTSLPSQAVIEWQIPKDGRWLIRLSNPAGSDPCST